MIDIQAIPEIAKHQVAVLSDAIHPIATDPRVKSARRQVVGVLHRASGAVRRPSSRPNAWIIVAGAALTLAAVVAAVTVRVRRSRRSAPADVAAIAVDHGDRKNVARTNGRHAQKAQSVA
jgi:hypothetical protein